MGARKLGAQRVSGRPGSFDGLLLAGALALLGLVLASCAGHDPGFAPGEEIIVQPGEATSELAPPVIREVIEAGNLLAAGLDLYSQGADLPSGFSLPREEALAGIARLEALEPAITWIGHATFLVRLGGRTFLTDPLFSDRVLSDDFGPRRLVPLAIDVPDLPHIDAIVISHADVDHLDRRSLRRLAARFPAAAVIMPLRNADLLRDVGFSDLRELAWEATTQIGEVTIRALPAYHGNRREPGNPFRREWASFGFEAGDERVFFAGDTGYGPAFEGIRHRHGRYETALVPIGAYEPRSAVKHIHTNPEEAAQIARDLGARLAVGMHWGTFALSSVPPSEPGRRFVESGGNGITARTLRIGETLALP